MGRIFAKRSEGQYPMCKNNQMSNIRIVTLENILEISEFKRSVDIKRNQSNILHQKTKQIQLVLVSIDLLEASHKGKQKMI